MTRLLVAALLLALPIGLMSVPEGGLMWRLEQCWQALMLAGVPEGEHARERIDAQLLANGNIGGTMLDAWRTAASKSLDTPWPVTLPYAETLTTVGVSTRYATTFTMELDPTRVLRIDTVSAVGSVGGLIIDVFDGPLVASFGPAPLSERISFDAWTQATAPPPPDAPPASVRTVLVRVQPTPDAIGRFDISLSSRSTLAFPVATDRERPVRSFFGMPRDGGSRAHHGIDIFAPRGTPVLAAADGVIRRTGNSSRGGLHVWQRALDDNGGAVGSLYYAHLDRIDVAAGERVNRGTPIGTVGNTGNARTTPPHLHFGLYRRFAGPIDPLLLTGLNRTVESTLESGDALPGWMAVSSARANLRTSPSLESTVSGQALEGELLAVHAAATDKRWVRITTGTGLQAWVARSLLDAVDANEAPLILEAESDLLAAPARDAAVLSRLARDSSVQVSGRFGDARRVQTDEGLIGWMLDLERTGLE